ncbi:molybdopterin-guanine dinucleotide biosynthesis protein B [Virgibacillus xinjiangensis]|uniref:Molybdopterin-guanine dinucleotide biosynthesis protein B n=1 Tax=Virgibacillus xinjiangensis TaxID=393090 RepID=A0ABV7CWK8_9BACI
MQIIQVAGYKNSGKTTLVSELVHAFSETGISTAALKHHGHGGLPLGLEDTDSAKHLHAGAAFSGVEGEGLLQISSADGWSLGKMVEIYELLGTELLVVEGFKRENYPKIILLRTAEEAKLLEQAMNIIAVVSAFPLDSDPGVPFFHWQQRNRMAEWLIDYLGITS